MPIFLTPHLAVSLWKWFRAEKFTQVFDLSARPRTNWYFRLIGFKKPDWNGAVEWCSQPYENVRSGMLHIVDRLRDQLREAHIARTPEPEVKWLKPSVSKEKLSKTYALVLLDAERIEPQYHPYGLSDVLDWLDEQGVSAVLAWTDKRAEKLGKQTVGMCRDAKPVLLKKSSSAAEILGLAKKAKVTIGHNAGGLYVVALAGYDVLMLATDAQPIHLTAPRGDNVIGLSHRDFDSLEADSITPVLRDMFEG